VCSWHPQKVNRYSNRRPQYKSLSGVTELDGRRISLVVNSLGCHCILTRERRQLKNLTCFIAEISFFFKFYPRCYDLGLELIYIKQRISKNLNTRRDGAMTADLTRLVLGCLEGFLYGTIFILTMTRPFLNEVRNYLQDSTLAYSPCIYNTMHPKKTTNLFSSMRSLSYIFYL
jgi:hypothetical protein